MYHKEKNGIIVTDAAEGREKTSMKELLIQPNDAGQRLDKFLQKAVPRLPSGLMYKYLRLKRIKVNGKRGDIRQKLQTGDCIQLYINDEFFQQQAEYDFLTAPSGIEAVYADDQILLVNKPQGLVVHEDSQSSSDTLIKRVLHTLYLRGEYDPKREQSFTPALCNRIDRNTCGLVIVAKTAPALRILNEKIRNREIKKEYLCILLGVPAKKQGTLKNYLLKDSSANRVKVFDAPRPGAKTAVTHYRVLTHNGSLSLVRVQLETGRTHQIRAQMAHIGHPLLGDGKYGFGEENRRYEMVHQALCADRVTFCFSTPAGELDYLKGKTVKLPSVWFCSRFFPDWQP